MKTSIYLNKEFQDDNVYGEVSLMDTSEFLGMPVVQKSSKVVISNGQAVNFCSPSYGLLKNNDFFGKMEHELIDEGIQYKRRSFNHNESRFYVDYILDDDSKVLTINNTTSRGIDDTIVPMIRLTNSYDSSLKTAGYIGFFRKVCNNGLHMASTQLEFNVKHTKGNMELFIPNIEAIVKRFLDNEMYTIKEKIDKMKEHFINEKDLHNHIQQVVETTKAFRYDKSDKNTAPSLNSELVHGIILRDAESTNVEPNAWLLYSGFNELIHGKLQKNFTDQKALDTNVFNAVTEMVL